MPPPSEIKVYVVDYGRSSLYMRYVDPVTGKQVLRSTKKKYQRDAERVAAVWESELRSGQYKADGRMPWAQFEDQYLTNHVAALKAPTQQRIIGVLSMFRRTMQPATIGAVTAQMIADYQTHLRAGTVEEVDPEQKKGKRSAQTVATHTGALRAALQWAVDLGYLRELPPFRRIARVKGKAKGKAKPMKGRPISAAEFDEMLKHVAAIVGESMAPSMTRLLRGLWLSGLRLEEGLVLSWDDPSGLMIDMGGRRPVMRIEGDAEKGGTTRILPLAPEFAEFLQQTPEADRTGPVFPLDKRKKRSKPMTARAASRLISAIGEKAGIIVDQASKKTVSAHDLRRSFGSRWATRVMPQVLMELMRHANISTTLRYYVGLDAERTADVLWSVHQAADVPKIDS